MKIRNETYIDLMHRMTGYNIGVIERYVKSYNNKQMGDLTLKDIYNSDTFLKLHNLEKRMKIEKLIKKVVD